MTVKAKILKKIKGKGVRTVVTSSKSNKEFFYDSQVIFVNLSFLKQFLKIFSFLFYFPIVKCLCLHFSNSKSFHILKSSSSVLETIVTITLIFLSLSFFNLWAIYTETAHFSQIKWRKISIMEYRKKYVQTKLEKFVSRRSIELKKIILKTAFFKIRNIIWKVNIPFKLQTFHIKFNPKYFANLLLKQVISENAINSS